MLEAYKDQMINALQKLIAIPSVKYDGLEENDYSITKNAPFGIHISKALDYTLALCKELGFRTKNCNGFVGYAEIGEGKEMMAILTHLDVVPSGNGWTYPPFGAEVHDDKLFGRGAIDDKGPAIASIYALKAVADKGVKWKKRVRLIFGVDEEKTWKDMEYYVSHEEQPTLGFTPDASFPVVYCEKELVHCDLVKYLNGTGMQWTLSGGAANNAVPDSCKLEWTDAGKTYTREEKGIAAHGSRPEEGVNAITGLMRKLHTQMNEGSSTFPKELEDCIQFYQACIGDAVDGSLLGIDFSDAISGGTTMNMGKIRGNEKECRLSIDIRMSLSTAKAEVLECMQKKIKPFGYEIENVTNFSSVYLEKESPFFQTLVKIYRQFTDDYTEPILMGGGTYARAMKNIVAFGPRFPGREETEHQKNEYILIEDFMKSAEIYAATIVEIATEM